MTTVRSAAVWAVLGMTSALLAAISLIGSIAGPM
jgi:hypothetical protein